MRPLHRDASIFHKHDLIHLFHASKMMGDPYDGFLAQCMEQSLRQITLSNRIESDSRLVKQHDRSIFSKIRASAIR